MKTDPEAIRQAMQQVMGTWPGPERRAPLAVQVDGEERTARFVRRKLSYASAPGERVPAYLLIPQGLANPAPAVLCLHQTTAIAKDETAGRGGQPSLQIGKELAERGFVVLAPDYPTLGEHTIDLAAQGWVSGSMKAIWDNRAGVDLLQSLPEVEGRWIGAAGHSLGGHNALFTAAFEPRIGCVVASCGFTAFSHYEGGDLTGWTSARYMPRIRTHFPTPAQMPFDFDDVLAAIAPRPVFVCAPLHDTNFAVAGVRETIARVAPHYRRLGAAERLQAVYPDAGHDFPDAERAAAFTWLERWFSA